MWLIPGLVASDPATYEVCFIVFVIFPSPLKKNF